MRRADRGYPNKREKLESEILADQIVRESHRSVSRRWRVPEGQIKKIGSMVTSREH